MRDRLYDLGAWLADPRNLFVSGAWLVCLAAWILVGGVHPWSVVGLSTGALLLGAATLIYSVARHRRTALGFAFLLPAAVAALALFQALPLPRGLVALLDGRTADTFAAVTKYLPATPALRITWDGPSTVLAALFHAALAALVLAGTVIARRHGETERVAWGLDALLLGLAGLAILNWLTDPGRLWWTYRPKAPQPFAILPMVNANHAAGLYVLALCLHLGLVAGLPPGRKQRFLFGLALLPAFLVAFAQSRSGYAGALFGLFLLGLLLVRHRRMAPKAFWQAAAAVGLVAAGLLPSVAYLREAFGQAGIEGIPEDTKVALWGRGLKMAADHFLVGTGRGAYEVAFTRYNDLVSGTVSHAENLLVQLAADLGLLATAGLLAAAAIGAWRFFRRRSLTPVQIGITAGLGGLLLQNLGDFNLEFPGTAFPAALLAGLLAANQRVRRRKRRDSSRKSRLPDTTGPMEALRRTRVRHAAAGASLLLGLAALAWAIAWAAPHAYVPESRRIQEKMEARRFAQAARLLDRALPAHPLSGQLHLLAGTAMAALRQGRPLAALNAAMLLMPHDPRPHLQAGRALALAGRWSQAANEYREAFRLGWKPKPSQWQELAYLARQLAAQVRPKEQAFAAAAGLAGLAGPPGALEVLGASAALLGHKALVIAATGAVPAEPQAWTALAGRLIASAGRELGAMVLQAVARRWPKEAGVLLRLSNMALRRRDLTEALWWARKYAEARPDPQAYLRLVRLTERLQGLEAAYRLARTARSHHPESIPLTLLLARLALEEGRPEEAATLLADLQRRRDIPLREKPKILEVEIEIARKKGDLFRARRLQRRLERLRIAIGLQGGRVPNGGR